MNEQKTPTEPHIHTSASLPLLFAYTHIVVYYILCCMLLCYRRRAILLQHMILFALPRSPNWLACRAHVVHFVYFRNSNECKIEFNLLNLLTEALNRNRQKFDSPIDFFLFSSNFQFQSEFLDANLLHNLHVPSTVDAGRWTSLFNFQKEISNAKRIQFNVCLDVDPYLAFGAATGPFGQRHSQRLRQFAMPVWHCSVNLYVLSEENEK